MLLDARKLARVCGGNGAEVLVPGWLQSEGADMSQERNCVGGLCSEGDVMEYG